MCKNIHFICIAHSPWVTIGVGKTIVSLDEVAADEKVAVRDVLLVRENGVPIVMSR